MKILDVHILTWVGIFVVLIGTGLTFLGQQRSSDKSSKEISDKADKIQSLTENNIKLSQQLANTATKNAELSEELKKYLTSGDSYCYILPMPDQISDRQSFLLLHEGKYPLYDVTIEFIDQSLMSGLPLKNLYDNIIESQKEDVEAGRPKERDLYAEISDLREKAIVRIPIGTLGPKTARELGRLDMRGRKEADFRITISTRNAFFSEHIREERVDKGWRYSWQVTRTENNESIILKEHINPKLPLIPPEESSPSKDIPKQ